MIVAQEDLSVVRIEIPFFKLSYFKNKNNNTGRRQSKFPAGNFALLGTPKEPTLASPPPILFLFFLIESPISTLTAAPEK